MRFRLFFRKEIIHLSRQCQIGSTYNQAKEQGYLEVGNRDRMEVSDGRAVCRCLVTAHKRTTKIVMTVGKDFFSPMCTWILRCCWHKTCMMWKALHLDITTGYFYHCFLLSTLGVTIEALNYYEVCLLWQPASIALHTNQIARHCDSYEISAGQAGSTLAGSRSALPCVGMGQP